MGSYTLETSLACLVPSCRQTYIKLSAHKVFSWPDLKSRRKNKMSGCLIILLLIGHPELGFFIAAAGLFCKGVTQKCPINIWFQAFQAKYSKV